MRYRPTSCRPSARRSRAPFDHPEITVQLAEPSRIPDVYRMLLGYFEGAVARGTRFLPGQTIQFGWARLRLCVRTDGTIGVEERELTPDVRWTQSVDRALRDTWLQREINANLGLLGDPRGARASAPERSRGGRGLTP